MQNRKKSSVNGLPGHKRLSQIQINAEGMQSEKHCILNKRREARKVVLAGGAFETSSIQS